MAHHSQFSFIKIASWNVNSIRVRIGHVVKWLSEVKPDVLLLQELKTKEEFFPKEDLENLGYNIALLGQKTYNGVAILSKFPISDVTYNLPNYIEDKQARYIEAWINHERQGFRVASIYVPNGNPINSEKYIYKINWMKKLHEHVNRILGNEEPIILGGDFNVCPEDIDAANPSRLEKDAVFMPEIRSLYRKILYSGYIDSFRTFNNDNIEYTYWDYGKSFTHNDGLRIDHLLLSPYAADICQKILIDAKPRSWERPSDHTPIFCKLC